MKYTFLRITKATCAIAIGAIIGQGQLAMAGWSGAMNSSGYGQATVSVRAFDTSLIKTKTISSTNMVGPSASMAPTTGYATNAPLPADSSSATVAKVKGSAGYIWQATTVGSDGDYTDNPELEAKVRVIPADCASLTMESSAEIGPDNNSGVISVKATGTAGTAIWMRGFEYVGDPNLLPVDDPATSPNEFVEFLKTNANSTLKWDVTMVGPFNQNSDCTSWKIPFTCETTTENLYFVSDGVAKSLPLEIVTCPPDITFDCQQPVQYPQEVEVAGCGEITLAFSPPYPAGGSYPAGSFPVGVTPVTVTVTDKDGNSRSCQFKVTVTDTQAPVAPVLSPVIGTCSTPVTPTAPKATDNCAVTVTGTPNTQFPITTIGTTIVTWTFNDGNGNTSTAEQSVTIPGLDFHGFYSPIGGTGGTCAKPLRTANLGNNLPVKFDVECGGSRVLTGQPMLTIEKSSADCSSLSPIGGGVFTLVGNEWHFNWATGSGTSVTAGNYKLTATLQDGTQRFVWIKLK